MSTRAIYLISDPLPVVIVIAASTIVTAAIGAWLVHQVASKALDKTTPEGVAQVILALGGLLRPLGLYLPWSRQKTSPGSSEPLGEAVPIASHNEATPRLPEAGDNEA